MMDSRYTVTCYMKAGQIPESERERMKAKCDGDH